MSTLKSYAATLVLLVAITLIAIALVSPTVLGDAGRTPYPEPDLLLPIVGNSSFITSFSWGSEHTLVNCHACPA